MRAVNLFRGAWPSKINRTEYKLFECLIVWKNSNLERVRMFKYCDEFIRSDFTCNTWMQYMFNAQFAVYYSLFRIEFLFELIIYCAMRMFISVDSVDSIYYFNKNTENDRNWTNWLSNTVFRSVYHKNSVAILIEIVLNNIRICWDYTCVA